MQNECINVFHQFRHNVNNSFVYLKYLSNVVFAHLDGIWGSKEHWWVIASSDEYCARRSGVV